MVCSVTLHSRSCERWSYSALEEVVDHCVLLKMKMWNFLAKSRPFFSWAIRFKGMNWAWADTFPEKSMPAGKARNSCRLCVLLPRPECLSIAICTSPKIHLVCPPTPPPPPPRKSTIYIAFAFPSSWVYCNHLQRNWWQYLCKILSGGGGEQGVLIWEMCKLSA